MTIGGITIDGRSLSSEHPPYIVAELCANHNGSLERALSIIEAAKAAGADAVKLQTYTPDTMTIDSSNPEFLLKGGLWDGYRLYELYQKAYTPWEWHEALFAKGREVGITVFSTPFDETAVDFLEQFNPPAYKIASFELIDIPLIQKAASTGKPIILSTGNGSELEIASALDACRGSGARDVILLHCVSAYPAPAEESNLRAIIYLRQRFGTQIGLSDHTLGTAVSIAATALGACMIEKHFTLDKAQEDIDGPFSIEPHELSRLVQDTKVAWSCLGSGRLDRAPSEGAMKQFRRSLYTVADIAEGDVFSRDNIRSIRPGNGLSPAHLPEIIGRRAKKSIMRGTPLAWELVL
ncbi:MAG: pseudaminic acid synthase [Alphaproteobacteria bacterium]|nr:pseudaminic acid synthase [Alphaproteobacteria bacterium]